MAPCCVFCGDELFVRSIVCHLTGRRFRARRLLDGVFEKTYTAGKFSLFYEGRSDSKQDVDGMIVISMRVPCAAKRTSSAIEGRYAISQPQLTSIE